MGSGLDYGGGGGFQKTHKVWLTWLRDGPMIRIADIYLFTQPASKYPLSIFHSQALFPGLMDTNVRQRTTNSLL